VPDRSDSPREDLAVVERTARLLLFARRRGWQVSVVECTPEAAELLELCGISSCSGLRLEVIGQAEQREESVGVQEEGDPADHPA
jgi:hypothetical protein